MTPGAVSRQIRALERDLGLALFARTARSVTLTPDGRRYYEAVARAFDAIAHATAAARNTTHLAVSLLPSFASLWLMPRLPRFEERHPDVRIDLHLSYELVDPRRGEVQVAIRYGSGGYEGVHARRLFAETLVPVASPAAARAAPRGALW